VRPAVRRLLTAILALAAVYLAAAASVTAVAHGTPAVPVAGQHLVVTGR
jgi:hypothetical protein